MLPGYTLLAVTLNLADYLSEGDRETESSGRVVAHPSVPPLSYHIPPQLQAN